MHLVSKNHEMKNRRLLSSFDINYILQWQRIGKPIISVTFKGHTPTDRSAGYRFQPDLKE